VISGSGAPAAAAMPRIVRSTAAWTCWRISGSSVRTVPASSTDSGITLLVLPPWIEPGDHRLARGVDLAAHDRLERDDHLRGDDDRVLGLVRIGAVTALPDHAHAELVDIPRGVARAVGDLSVGDGRMVVDAEDRLGLAVAGEEAGLGRGAPAPISSAGSMTKRTEPGSVARSARGRAVPGNGRVDVVAAGGDTTSRPRMVSRAVEA
jgi:hypothetical protein